VELRHPDIARLLCASLVPLAMIASCTGEPTFPTCKAEPPREDVEAAQGAHAAATRFFEKGAYDRAIALWQAAYELDCSAHPLLINIGRAQERNGDATAAMATYRVYVERAGKAADPAIVALVRAADPTPAPAPSAPPRRAPAAAPPATAKPSASSP
jgi:hypothetical protein